MTPTPQPKPKRVQPNRRKGTGVHPMTLQLVAEHVARHLAEHGTPPTVRATANALEFHERTIRAAWSQAIDFGLLSVRPGTVSPETRSRQCAASQFRSDSCSFETAQKIVDLLRTDYEARIKWILLIHGESRGPR